MNDANSLSFPVLCFARDHSITVADSPEHLQSCNALAWYRNRYYQDMKLVDHSATPYRVVDARLAMPLAGWRRSWARVRNQRLTVALQLARGGDASLEAARQTAIEWVRRDPTFWEAAGDLAELEDRIRRSPDMTVLCQIFR